MRIRLLPDAETDLELAADFYESQAEGLGEYFLLSLVSDIESLKLFCRHSRIEIWLSPVDFQTISVCDLLSI